MPSNDYSPEQWQGLLDRWEIVFERPINPRKWPREYEKVFGVIRQIGRQWMEDYLRNKDFDILPLRLKQARVVELVNAARSCMSSFVDEDDWREKTEDKVLSRFDSEVICQSCRSYLWLSDFETWSENENAAEKQRHRRSRRRLCHCNILDRLPADIGDDGRQPLFQSVRKTGIDHDDIDEREGETLLKKQRPDRVIGLNLTKTLAERIASDRFRTNTHTPILGKNIFYPFLVLEAKREKGPGPGFTGIEHQTAFPIRTCLKLQQNLRQETGVDLQCLVWFFAFRGEEWRLYGAVPDKDKTVSTFASSLALLRAQVTKQQRIFDLWHGTVLSEDGALQLCLIVDYICTWARNEYREQVLACLASGSGLLRRFTSPMPSQQGDIDPSCRWDRGSISSRWPSVEPNSLHGDVPETNAHTLSEDVMMTNLHMELENHRQQEPGSQEDVYNWLRFTTTSHGSPPWTRVGTIRHANLVQLLFQELTLPNDGEALRRCLAICFPGESIKNVARRLLATVKYSGVCFGESKHDETLELDGSPARVKDFIYLRTQLRPEDWQIERYVLCITCTSGAAQELHGIAEYEAIDLGALNMWHMHDCQCLLRELDRFKLLGGKKGASLAMSPLSERQMCFKLCLNHEGEEHFMAQGFRPGQSGQLNQKDLKSIQKAINERRGLEGNVTEHQSAFRVPPQTEHMNMTGARMERPDLGDEQCMLIKKCPHWPATTPEFCLLTLDEDLDFNDEAKLAGLIKKLVDRNRPEVFGIPSGQIEARDKLFFQRWIRVLGGELPAATPFNR